jgi:hypothetical protein
MSWIPPDPFVAGVLAGAEVAAVARIAVQQVVQTLRDGEELRFVHPVTVAPHGPTAGEQFLRIGDHRPYSDRS